MEQTVDERIIEERTEDKHEYVKVGKKFKIGPHTLGFNDGVSDVRSHLDQEELIQNSIR